MTTNELPQVVRDNKELFSIIEQIIILSSLMGYSIKVINHSMKLNNKFFCSLSLYDGEEGILELMSYYNTNKEFIGSSFSNSIERIYVSSNSMRDIGPAKKMLDYLINQ